MTTSRFSAAVATVGGVGYLTKMPGTMGSAVACALYLLFPIPWWGILIVALLGVFCSDVYSKANEVLDPGEVVIDEVVGMWISLAGLPPGCALAAFLLFRIVDIVKPGPVGKVEKLPGGWGIMADDVVGGILTNSILRIILRMF
ncbi:MAG: phosphatidylglycerophosphatase A [Synergistaceae bacterium]|jgi:phosphatidylglycerophosphatase A|nr:phosphatidylglycerophosphatase A [Synergistaceae bacterium]